MLEMARIDPTEAGVPGTLDRTSAKTRQPSEGRDGWGALGFWKIADLTSCAFDGHGLRGLFGLNQQGKIEGAVGWGRYRQTDPDRGFCIK